MPPHDPPPQIFRGLGNLLLLLSLLPFLLLTSQHMNIDYRRLLQLPPSLPTLSTSFRIWSHTSHLAIAFLLSYLAYCKGLRTAFRHQFPLTLAHLLPLSLFATYVAYYLLVLRKSASLYPILRNTVLAPFGQYFISS